MEEKNIILFPLMRYYQFFHRDAEEILYIIWDRIKYIYKRKSSDVS